MTAPWRLLLTRPAAENPPLAAELAARGIASVSLPLLDIEPLPETAEQRSRIMDLDLYHAVIVISKPAARALLERVDCYWPQPPARQLWFAIGPATGELLLDFGLEARWSAAGTDSESLLAMPELAGLLEQEPSPRVLIAKGEGGRDLLQDCLQKKGVHVDTLVLYRRTLPDYPPGTFSRTVQAERLNGVVVTSGQALQFLHESEAAFWPTLSQSTFFVPSARVARLAQELGIVNVVDCCGAGAAALLAALGRHSSSATS